MAFRGIAADLTRLQETIVSGAEIRQTTRDHGLQSTGYSSSAPRLKAVATTERGMNIAARLEVLEDVQAASEMAASEASLVALPDSPGWARTQIDFGSSSAISNISQFQSPGPSQHVRRYDQTPQIAPTPIGNVVENAFRAARINRLADTFGIRPSTTDVEAIDRRVSAQVNVSTAAVPGSTRKPPLASGRKPYSAMTMLQIDETFGAPDEPAPSEPASPLQSRDAPDVMAQAPSTGYRLAASTTATASATGRPASSRPSAHGSRLDLGGAAAVHSSGSTHSGSSSGGSRGSITPSTSSSSLEGQGQIGSAIGIGSAAGAAPLTAHLPADAPVLREAASASVLPSPSSSTAAALEGVQAQLSALTAMLQSMTAAGSGNVAVLPLSPPLPQHHHHQPAAQQQLQQHGGLLLQHQQHADSAVKAHGRGAATPHTLPAAAPPMTNDRRMRPGNLLYSPVAPYPQYQAAQQGVTSSGPVQQIMPAHHQHQPAAAPAVLRAQNYPAVPPTPAPQQQQQHGAQVAASPAAFTNGNYAYLKSPAVMPGAAVYQYAYRYAQPAAGAAAGPLPGESGAAVAVGAAAPVSAAAESLPSSSSAIHRAVAALSEAYTSERLRAQAFTSAHGQTTQQAAQLASTIAAVQTLAARLEAVAGGIAGAGIGAGSTGGALYAASPPVASYGARPESPDPHGPSRSPTDRSTTQSAAAAASAAGAGGAGRVLALSPQLSPARGGTMQALGLVQHSAAGASALAAQVQPYAHSHDSDADALPTVHVSLHAAPAASSGAASQPFTSSTTPSSTSAAVAVPMSSLPVPMLSYRQGIIGQPIASPHGPPSLAQAGGFRPLSTAAPSSAAATASFAAMHSPPSYNSTPSIAAAAAVSTSSSRHRTGVRPLPATGSAADDLHLFPALQPRKLPDTSAPIPPAPASDAANGSVGSSVVASSSSRAVADEVAAQPAVVQLQAAPAAKAAVPAPALAPLPAAVPASPPAVLAVTAAAISPASLTRRSEVELSTSPSSQAPTSPASALLAHTAATAAAAAIASTPTSPVLIVGRVHVDTSSSSPQLIQTSPSMHLFPDGMKPLMPMKIAEAGTSPVLRSVTATSSPSSAIPKLPLAAISSQAAASASSSSLPIHEEPASARAQQEQVPRVASSTSSTSSRMESASRDPTAPPAAATSSGSSSDRSAAAAAVLPASSSSLPAGVAAADADADDHGQHDEYDQLRQAHDPFFAPLSARSAVSPAPASAQLSARSLAPAASALSPANAAPPNTTLPTASPAAAAMQSLSVVAAAAASSTSTPWVEALMENIRASADEAVAAIVGVDVDGEGGVNTASAHSAALAVAAAEAASAAGVVLPKPALPPTPAASVQPLPAGALSSQQGRTRAPSSQVIEAAVETGSSASSSSSAPATLPPSTSSASPAAAVSSSAAAVSAPSAPTFDSGIFVHPSHDIVVATSPFPAATAAAGTALSPPFSSTSVSSLAQGAAEAAPEVEAVGSAADGQPAPAPWVVVDASSSPSLSASAALPAPSLPFSPSPRSFAEVQASIAVAGLGVGSGDDTEGGADGRAPATSTDAGRGDASGSGAEAEADDAGHDEDGLFDAAAASEPTTDMPDIPPTPQSATADDTGIIDQQQQMEDAKADAAGSTTPAPPSASPSPPAAAPASAVPGLEPSHLAIVLQLLNGHLFSKHGRSGWPHKRIVWLDVSSDELGLRWGKPEDGISYRHLPTAKAAESWMGLGAIQNIARGRQTLVMKRSGKAAKEELYWSIVSAKRSLDLECASKSECEAWAAAFEVILTRTGLLQDALMYLYRSGQWAPPAQSEEDETEE